MPKVLRVWFLAAEAVPFVKVGGLGDVAGSLPLALRALDATPLGYRQVDVRLVIPLHGGIRQRGFDLQRIARLEVSQRAGRLPGEAYTTEWRGMPVYLIAGPLIPPDGPVYTGDPLLDGEKFAFFSLAALALARQLEWPPDVLHANDWHTAPAIYWLARHRARGAETAAFFDRTTTLLGLHNLPYLGVGTEPALLDFDLPPATGSALPPWAQGLPLPQGLLTADHIVAVSPGYAREILTPEFGSGLHDFLRTRQDAISGILNGIDQNQWDPASDEHISARYSIASLPLRARNKAALQQEAGLPVDPATLLMAMVTRMTSQKGVDLALDALRQISDQPWQFVLLGTGEPPLEARARELQRAFPDRVRAEIRFDLPFSRRIFAGTDAILIPSRYEPSGLTQMIAMRYGCVPIARATGGLRDSIVDYTSDRQGTGFLFADASAQALAGAIRRALSAFRDKRRWQGLQRRGMRQDFSWNRSAQAYLQLYLRLVAGRQGT